MRRMPRLVAIISALGLAAAALVATAPSRGASLDLQLQLSRALTAPGIDPQQTAALAVDLRTGSTIFDVNSDTPLRPASAEKLAVAFAALRLLGPGYRFRTELVGAGRREGETWKGNLVLVGGGDPSLGLSDLDRLSRKVAASGIRHVSGRVLGDESRFDARRGSPGWKASFVGIESPPLSALSVKGVPLGGPSSSARAAARALKFSLARRGVVVEGRPGQGRAREGALSLAHDVSLPLALLVRRMNRESDNFYSELLLKELGARSSEHGTTRAGVRAVRQALAEARIPLRGVRLADGSGLSLHDRLTTEALVAILLAGSSDPTMRDAFVASLAVAGVSGTMERRLDRRPTRGRVLAKTGTTDAACALAGFVGTRYVFAIVQNGSPVPYWTARAAQDRFVTLLARS